MNQNNHVPLIEIIIDDYQPKKQVFKKYLKSWETVFELKDWIAPSQNGTKAYCKWCKFEMMAKKSVLMKHSKSFKHEHAKNKQNLPNQSNTIHSVATNFNQNFKIGKHEAEVRLALQQAVHGNISSGTHLVDVMKKIGSIHEKATLKRTKCTKIATNTLAPLFRKLIITDMVGDKCNFYIDESTDKSGCSFLGTDGASSMTGKKNGFGEILRKENPNIISISCTSHALQNACLSATRRTIPNA